MATHDGHDAERSGWSDKAVQRLKARLERCCARADELSQTLADEAQCLAERRLDGMDELLRQKGSQVQALEEAETRLRQTLEELGYEPGPSGTRALLRSAPAALREAWDGLEERLRAIQARNEANGRLIHRNLEHTERLLDIATGAHERADQVTYGTSGAYSPTSRSRKITEA